MKKALLLFIVLLPVFLVCACKDERASHGSAQVSMVKVRAEVANPVALSSERSYSGTFEAETATPVSFASAGTILTLSVREGDFVRKGDPIGTLDETSAKSALEIAQAMKAQAEDALSRMKQLHKNKSISEMQWAEVESKYKQAAGSEKMAAKALADCKLYAAATGVVSGKNAEVGENVLPGSPVLKIIDIKKLKAKVFVPESEMGNLRIGDKVTVSVGALGGESFAGKITEKGVEANVLSRSYAVSASIENKKGTLLPGMILDMRILSKDSSRGISVPASAIRLDEKNGAFVWVVKGGKAERANLTLGEERSNGIVVLNGIVEGDSVIVEGAQKVGQGSAVEIVP